jgi:hypothetical protein
MMTKWGGGGEYGKYEEERVVSDVNVVPLYTLLDFIGG